MKLQVHPTIRLFVEEIARRPKQPSGFKTVAFEVVVNELLELYLRQAETSMRAPHHDFEFLMRHGGLKSLSTFVVSWLKHSENLSASSIKKANLPSLQALCDIARGHNLPLSSEPFGRAIRETINLWIGLILGPRPQIGVGVPIPNQWDCRCDPCTQIRSFMSSGDTDGEKRFERLGPNKQNHVLGIFREHFPKSNVTVKMQQIKGHGLMVRKP
jgi:hypothetical protein